MQNQNELIGKATDPKMYKKAFSEFKKTNNLTFSIQPHFIRFQDKLLE